VRKEKGEVLGAQVTFWFLSRSQRGRGWIRLGFPAKNKGWIRVLRQWAGCAKRLGRSTFPFSIVFQNLLFLPSYLAFSHNNNTAGFASFFWFLFFFCFRKFLGASRAVISLFYGLFLFSGFICFIYLFDFFCLVCVLFLLLHISKLKIV
jgi:hypothetical protein